MAKVKEIIEKIEKLAPLSTQEIWDNSGWQINLNNKNSKKILIALDVTEKTVKQAIAENCDLIISHHPLFFNPVKCISKKEIILAIQNNIQIYSTHTCFDKAKNGTTETLVNTLKKELNLTSIKIFNDFTKTAKLKTPLKLKEFTGKLKKALNIKYLKIANPCKEIRTVAICAGAGADFISDIQSANIDCFISADIKYHQARGNSIMIADIGHFESEIISLKSIGEVLNFPDLEIIYGKEAPIFEIL